MSGGDFVTLEVGPISSSNLSSQMDQVVVGSDAVLPMSIPMIDQGNGQYIASFMANLDTFYTSAIIMAQGIKAVYFDNISWTEPAAGSRIEDNVWYRWSKQENMGLATQPDVGSAIWTGQLVPPTTGVYLFGIYHDGDMTFQLGDKLIQGKNQGQKWAGNYKLTAGVSYDFLATLKSDCCGSKAMQMMWQTKYQWQVPIPASSFFQKGTNFPQSSASQSTLTYSSATVEDQAYNVTLQVRDNAGNINNVSTDVIDIRLTHRSDNVYYFYTATHTSNGNYSAILFPTVFGLYSLSATINGEPTDSYEVEVIVYCDLLALEAPPDISVTVEMGYGETVEVSMTETNGVTFPSDSCPLFLSTPIGTDLIFIFGFEILVTTVDATLIGEQVRTVSIQRLGSSYSLDFTVTINVIPSCALSALQQVRAPFDMRAPFLGNTFQDLAPLFTHEYAEIWPVDTCVIKFEIKTTGDTSYLTLDSVTDDSLLTSSLHLYPRILTDEGTHSIEVVASYLYYSEQEAPYNTLTSSTFKVIILPECYDQVKCHCDWSEMVKNYQEVQVPIFREGQQVQLDLDQMFSALSYPECYLFGDEQVQEISYFAFQLIEDNRGRLYSEDADPPISMYIAKPLGQETLIFSQTDPAYLKFTFDSLLHGGEWKFQVKACVEIFDAIDCDNGVNEVILNIQNVCDSDETENFPEECNVKDINRAPYFITFDETNLYELKRGDPPLTIQLSDYIDEDGDMVELEVTFDDEQMQEWITFDRDYKRFEVRPVDQTPLGLTTIGVLLDDGIDRSEYFIQIWIDQAADTVDLENLDDDEKDEEIIDQPSESEAEAEAEAERVFIMSEPEPELEPIDSDDVDTEDKVQQDDETESMIEATPLGPAMPEESGQSSDLESEALWSLTKVRERIQKRQQSLPVIEEAKEPEVTIKLINENGVMMLKFSQEILLDKIFAGFDFSEESSFKDNDGGQDSQRRLKTDDLVVDLSSLIWAEVIRGDGETSVTSDKLGFKVELGIYSKDSIELKFDFASPLSLSTGDRPDVMIVEFVEPDLFVSKDTGKTLNAESVRIEHTIPKQFPTQSSYSLAVIVGDIVQIIADTAFLSQFALSICLTTISLKALWNLIHVMQVLAYLRLIVSWPANTQMMLQSAHNAVTLENLINPVYDSIMEIEDFSEDQIETEDDSGMAEKKAKLKRKDVSHRGDLGQQQSLGIFEILLGILISTTLLYMVVKIIFEKVHCCKSVHGFLKRKLFYNAWIRFMIESNLQIAHNCILFLYVNGSFDDLTAKYNTWLRILPLISFFVWPFFLLGFLYRNIKRLDEPVFKLKFVSMYLGIKKKLADLTYTSVFCFRRLLLVVIFFEFSSQRSTALLYAYNSLQSFYFWYIAFVKPHEDAIYNRLEIFSETCVITLQYLAMFHLYGGEVDPEFQWHVGIATTIIISLVFSVNLVALLYHNANRICFMLRVHKVKQAYLRVKAHRHALHQRDQLNNCQNLSQIQEELESEGNDVMMSSLAIESIEVSGSIDERASSSANFTEEDDDSSIDVVENIPVKCNLIGPVRIELSCHRIEEQDQVDESSGQDESAEYLQSLQLLDSSQQGRAQRPADTPFLSSAIQPKGHHQTKKFGSKMEEEKAGLDLLQPFKMTSLNPYSPISFPSNYKDYVTTQIDLSKGGKERQMLLARQLIIEPTAQGSSSLFGNSNSNTLTLNPQSQISFTSNIGNSTTTPTPTTEIELADVRLQESVEETLLARQLILEPTQDSMSMLGNSGFGDSISLRPAAASESRQLHRNNISVAVKPIARINFAGESPPT